MASVVLGPLKIRGKMEAPPDISIVVESASSTLKKLPPVEARERHLENSSLPTSALAEEGSLALEQLVSHIPDLVVSRAHDAPLPQTIHSYGVVMFADISGFTALCEKYCSGAKSKSDGTDQLTSTLNSYLSQIVQAILEAGGDILKFAGDALLAFWNCSRFAASGMLAYVLQESLMMQNDFDNYQTTDGVTLRMKLGLSVGKVEIHYIGNTNYRTFDITGEAIDDVNKAQSLTKPGEVVISKAAWEMSNKQRCFARLVGPGYAQVSKMLQDEEGSNQAPISTLVGNDQQKSTINTVIQNAAAPLRPQTAKRNSEGNAAVIRSNPWEDEKRASIMEGRIKSGRPSLQGGKILPGHLQQLGRGLNFRTGLKDLLVKMSTEKQEEMRTFILQTVVQKVDHGHEVSWLSELREVSVLFINLDPNPTNSAAGTLKLLQTSFDAIYPALAKYDGSLNKVFMFDKGCTFLCIFGLPNAKHEDDSSRALRAARDIFNNLKQLDLQQYAVGVTTGVAFCGVVGHPQRHEYTVIGQKVNMAARLMMNISNAVSCDETTKAKSNISDDQFTPGPPVKLKGITNPENIYTFSTDRHDSLDKYGSDMHILSDAEDLIGRDKEMAIFLEELMHVSEHTHRDPGVLMISGGGGLGKTKLLRAMKAKAAMMGFRVVSGIGGIIEQNTPFFCVKMLITRLLEMDSCKNLHEREQLVLSHTPDDSDLKSLLPLLNDILVLKFPHTQAITHMTPQERTKGLHKLLFNIVHQEALSKPCVFGIDDAHWIDSDSWEFLLDLAIDPNAILVLTTRPLGKTNKHPAMLEILNHRHTRVITLQGLSSDDTITLACQMLEVDTLPEEMQQIIRKKSHGIPLWCEELVETMLELEYLKIIEQDEVITEEEECLITVEDVNDIEEESCLPSESTECGIGVKVSNANGRKAVLQLKTRRKSTAHLSSGIGIGDIPIPDSVAGMVLARIDHMSPSEQMTLKCAAVVGTSFNRAMLEVIIPNGNPNSFHQSLKTLAEVGIIECAVAAEVRTMDTDMHTRSQHHMPVDDPHLHCPCLAKQNQQLKPAGNHLSVHHHKHGAHAHPPIDECEMLQFVHTYIQETAYGLWTESQRKALHESSALFLESQAHKCKNCGGGGFIAGGHRPSVQHKKGTAPTSRAFVGTANMKNKLRRRSTAGSARRASRMSISSINSTSQSVLDLERIVSGQEQANISTAIADMVNRPTTAEARMSGIRYESICASETIGVDMQDCHCDEILAHVYPQLVRHWRAAGDTQHTLKYLIEAASAAVATFNNMEAISLLHEAKTILEEKGDHMISEAEHARLESLIAQALFQSGRVDECMPHFHEALQMLHTKLPTNGMGAAIDLGRQVLRQLLHSKFPQRFLAKKIGLDSETFLDQARCLAHMTHVYHLQHKNLQTLMVALKQLNTVEEAQEDVHELIEAYATMIECCQHFNLKGLSNYYLERAMAHCSDVQFGVDDMHTYTHLLAVALNSKLCQGKVNEALEIGRASVKLTSKMHDIAIQLASLPLLFFTQMVADKKEQCTESLKELKEIASEADDLRAQALHDCCRFDALLEFGLSAEDTKNLVAAAETCCEEDIYHFDDIERFFLVSCLALWHVRKGNFNQAEKYESIATELLPNLLFETYIAVRALARFVECSLLVLKSPLYNGKKSTCRKRSKEALKKLKALSHKFTVFKSRALHMKAYWKHLGGKSAQSSKLLGKAVQVAGRNGCLFDADWAKASQKAWFGKRAASQNIFFVLS